MIEISFFLIFRLKCFWFCRGSSSPQSKLQYRVKDSDVCFAHVLVDDGWHIYDAVKDYYRLGLSVSLDAAFTRPPSFAITSSLPASPKDISDTKTSVPRLPSQVLLSLPFYFILFQLLLEITRAKSPKSPSHVPLTYWSFLKPLFLWNHSAKSKTCWTVKKKSSLVKILLFKRLTSRRCSETVTIRLDITYCFFMQLLSLRCMHQNHYLNTRRLNQVLLAHDIDLIVFFLSLWNVAFWSSFKWICVSERNSSI